MTASFDNPLRQYFENNPGRLMDKWLHYFDIYHRHFARYRGTDCVLMEIGVSHGGSLQMWKEYLGPGARIIGIDIDPRCKQFEEPGIQIHIGDQGDRGFLRALKPQLPPIDILIDDGGHHMHQLSISFEELYGSVKPDGVYLLEDLHTCYWKEYGGGYRSQFSFIEFSKLMIDHLNAYHSRDPNSFQVSQFTQSADSLHYYDSVLVIEKRPRMSPPTHKRTGTPSFPEFQGVAPKSA